jgi:DNA-binding SARP family transcriptional activator
VVCPSAKTQGGQARYTESDVRRVRYYRWLCDTRKQPDEDRIASLMALVEADLEASRMDTAEALLSAMRKSR